MHFFSAAFVVVVVEEEKIVKFLQSLIKVALISLSRLDNCKLNAKLIAPTHEILTQTHYNTHTNTRLHAITDAWPATKSNKCCCLRFV